MGSERARGSTLEQRWAADERSREIAQTVFDRPVLLEAGAGTGKTAALTARVVSWCMGPGWRGWEKQTEGGLPREIAGKVVESVLAVTFTEAAAAEMSTRVSEALRTIDAGQCPVGLFSDVLPDGEAERKRRARALLEVHDRLSISTLHAFCLRLLAEHPMEASIHPQLTVDGDSTVTEERIRDLLDRMLPELYARRDPDLMGLAERGVGPSQIAACLKFLAQKSIDPEVLAAPTVDSELAESILSELKRQLESFWRAGGRKLAQGSRVKKAEAAVQALDSLDGVVDPAHPSHTEAVSRVAEIIDGLVDQDFVATIKKWAKGNYTDSEEKGLEAGELVDVARAAKPLSVTLGHLSKMDVYGLEQARRVVYTLYSELTSDLRARGVLSFDGLVRKGAALLRRDPSLTARIRESLDQILVDEFQDTDRDQCELLELLALDGPTERRPALFVVGDPKQSIYGWRDADLAAYQSFKHRLEEKGAEIRSLTVNFRSTPVILKEVESVIEPIMQGEEGLQPRFEPLDPCKEKSAYLGYRDEARAAVEHWVSWVGDGDEPPEEKGTDVGRAAELEAEALARDIKEIARNGVGLGEVGVLFRSTTDLETYLDALRRHGVAFSVSRDRSYYQRREVIDTASLVRWVLDPNDHLAMLTALRSPLVGVPDAALLPLWARGFPRLATRIYGRDRQTVFDIDRAIADASGQTPAAGFGLNRIRGWQESLRAAARNVGVLREIFDTEPADVFTEALRRLFLVEPIEASRYLGAYRLANLRRLLREITETLDSDGGSVHQVLRLLRRSVAEAREAQDARPSESTEDAVQVMTIHSAKGLDFSHVYLAQAHKGGDPKNSEANEIEPRRAGACEKSDQRADLKLFGMPSWGYRKVIERKNEVRTREAVRTLYVAMTRAKDRLVVLGTWPQSAGSKKKTKKSGVEVVSGAKSYTELLLARDAPMPRLTELAETAGGEWRDEDGTKRWLFPYIWLKNEAPPEQEARLEADRVRAGGGGRPFSPGSPADLIASHREARSRMERPISMSASSAASHEVVEAVEHRNREGSAQMSLFDRDGRPARQEPDVEQVERPVAKAVGTAIHHALETWDPGSPIEEELEKAIEIASRRALFELDDRHSQLAAQKRIEAVLEAFGSGPLARRFSEIGPYIYGREVDVLLPPNEAFGPEGEKGPLGYVVGTIDLVYRDPSKGRWVVADYKTDVGDDRERVESLRAFYAPQMRVYAEALRLGLKLEEMPRMELWLLNARTIEEI